MNLKINIKRPQISKEEIAANKDFGELLKMYKASVKAPVPFYKSAWFYSGFSAAAAVVAAIIIYVVPSNHVRPTLAFVAPPIEKVAVTPSHYAVNADVENSITYKTGSVIKIPAKAFVYKSGKPVSGKVDLTYREMNDPIDFFLSGIPMNYDSGGTKYTFESAGMVEIHASQQGQELEINPEKEFAIAIASHQSGKQFNLYYLNAEKKQWEYRGQEEVAAPAANQAAVDSSCDGEVQSPQLAALDSKIEHAQYELQKSEAIVKHLEASRPFEPKEETKGHHRFALSASNINEFPELAIYKDVMFQASADENKDFDKKEYSNDWDDAKLSKKGNSYVLTLKNADLTKTYVVHPVFEGEGYNLAQKTYKSKLEEYQESLVERKATEGEKQQELAALTQVLQESRETEVAHLTHKDDLKETAANTPANPGNLTFHNFKVHSCGIWNLDNPTLLPQGGMVKAHFTDEQGKELTFALGKIYMVEKGRNILFSFDGSNNLSFNPEKENMIWGVTADNKIAVFSYENFKAMSKTVPAGSNYTFKMQVSDVELADETQVENYLNI